MNGSIIGLLTGVLFVQLTGTLPGRSQTPPALLSDSPLKNTELEIGSKPPDLAQKSDSIDPLNQSVLEQALEVANTLEDPEAKARLLTEISLNYAAIAQEEQAQRLLADALTVVDDIPEEERQVRAKTAIARAYFQLGQVETAADVLSAALATANSLDDLELKSGLLAEIALHYDQIGLGDRALGILSDSQVMARWIESDESPALFPFEPTGWEGQVGIGASFFSGAKITSETTFDFGLERQWARDEVAVGLSATNDYDDSRVSPEEDNQIKGQIDAEYRHHATERYQYFISSLVRRDEPDGIDIRTNLYTGPGINIWRAGPDRSFDMQLGLGIRYEDSNRRRDDLDFPVAQYRMRYKDVYFDFLTLRQFLTFELPFEDIEDYYLESSTTLGIPLIQRWSFNNSLILRYASDPSLDNPNLRVDFVTGIEYQF